MPNRPPLDIFGGGGHGGKLGWTEETHELAREAGVDLTEQFTPLAAVMRSPSAGPLGPVAPRDDPGATAQLRDDHRGLSAAWGSPSVHDQQRRCGREPAPPGLPE